MPQGGQFNQMIRQTPQYQLRQSLLMRRRQQEFKQQQQQQLMHQQQQQQERQWQLQQRQQQVGGRGDTNAGRGPPKVGYFVVVVVVLVFRQSFHAEILGTYTAQSATFLLSCLTFYFFVPLGIYALWKSSIKHEREKTKQNKQKGGGKKTLFFKFHQIL